MVSLEALAKVNLAISEAKGSLINLQEIETEYLEEREKKAVARIQKVLDNSGELLKEIGNNYTAIEEFAKNVSGFAKILTELYDKFCDLNESFQKKSKAFDERTKAQEIVFEGQKRQIKSDQVRIANDNKGLLAREEKVKADIRHIESQQAALETGYRLEKELWNKLHPQK